MKGSSFVNKLPSGTTSDGLARREKMIFDAVRRRDIAPIAWSEIETKYGPYTATFKVANDALRVGDATDSVRVTVNHETAQHIADELGTVLPTAKLNDEIWAQARVRLAPVIRPAWVKDQTMGNTARMLEQHNLIEAKVAAEQAKGNRGLIADVGKDWVTTKRLWGPPPPATPHCPDVGPIRSANYGWHGGVSAAATPAGGNVWQTVGLCHTMKHTDYSQMVRLIQRQVKVAGPFEGVGTGFIVFDIDQLAADPELAPLVSSEGSLEQMRHPAVLRSCEEGVRCPEARVRGMMLRSSCPLHCEQLPPPEPDPTASPGQPVINGVKPSEIAAAGVSYLPLLATAALAFVGTYWWVSRP